MARKGLTGEELAMWIGRDVLAWLDGAEVPHRHTVKKAAAHLQVDPFVLVPDLEPGALVEVMAAAGVTSEEVLRGSSLNRSELYSWMLGLRSPASERWEMPGVAEVLGVTVDELPLLPR